jgi:hypothetical protein
LLYERTTVFEHRLSFDFLDHDCTPGRASIGYISVQENRFFWTRYKLLFLTRYNVNPAGVMAPAGLRSLRGESTRCDWTAGRIDGSSETRIVVSESDVSGF